MDISDGLMNALNHNPYCKHRVKTNPIGELGYGCGKCIEEMHGMKNNIEDKLRDYTPTVNGQPFDIVQRPMHYNYSKLEPITVVEAWDLSFCLGNVVKYVARAGKKDPSKVVEDLEKARWYLDREISRLKGGK